ncbi:MULTISPECIES: tripartite tricarboxylate transporter substrate binding protein [Thalassospira]|uniref:tripartite tricarboxylate transporter substrate binding protein n=1 Tax=Thalassospira TaxID=168934 RepID=UPI0007A57FD6|nr:MULTISPECIES: tripartite tricarboxylate transporter substrate binding protein [unclassified Thalassospira]KZC99947.1 hypothetical protein AUQ41_09845 [Thalassospira sp. MCCC 1A02898]ONH85891.1 hypothetical protein TH47_17855 [Thalassospira sp. MCCC 1A02803]
MTFKKAMLAISAGALLFSITGANASEWTPKNNVEFIVPYSAGGGSDLNARALAEAIRENQLMEQNLLILNRPGGSGAVGNTYVASKEGDGSTIMTFNSGQMMSTISNDAAIKLESITPLGTLALDTLMLAVKVDASTTTFEELLAAANKDPLKITVGGTSRGSEDNLVFSLLNKPAGKTLQYVPFNGSADVLSALLGGHVNAGIFNPSEIAPQVEAGSVRVLGSFSAERLPGVFEDVPTFAELGYIEAVFEMFRGYAGPPNMTQEMIDFWNGVLGGAAQSEQWLKDVEAKGLIPTYLDAEESKRFWQKEEQRYVELLGELSGSN